MKFGKPSFFQYFSIPKIYVVHSENLCRQSHFGGEKQQDAGYINIYIYICRVLLVRRMRLRLPFGPSGKSSGPHFGKSSGPLFGKSSGPVSESLFLSRSCFKFTDTHLSDGFSVAEDT